MDQYNIHMEIHNTRRRNEETLYFHIQYFNYAKVFGKTNFIVIFHSLSPSLTLYTINLCNLLHIEEHV